MFDVKTAVRIALLENTGLAEVAIKSVVDAVVGMVERTIDLNEHAVKEIHDAYVSAHGSLPEELMMNDIMFEVLDMIRLSGGKPCCWIIERVGHPVSMTHYQTVADSQRSLGAIVTPHVSRLA